MEQPLTSATIQLKSGSTVLQTTNWTGTIQTYESAYSEPTLLREFGSPVSAVSMLLLPNPNGTEADLNAANNSATQSYLIYLSTGGP